MSALHHVHFNPEKNLSLSLQTHRSSDPRAEGHVQQLLKTLRYRRSLEELLHDLEAN